MLDLRRLLSDKQYKSYFMTPPALPRAARARSDPYYVYVQREAHGPWARASAASYKQAYDKLRRFLPDSFDVVIVSRRVAFDPPTRVVKVVKDGRPVMVNTPTGLVQKTKIVRWDWRRLLDLEGGDRPHDWCCYCMRPTEFRYFPKHHAFRDAVAYDVSRLRCTVCGASLDLVRNGARI